MAYGIRREREMRERDEEIRREEERKRIKEAEEYLAADRGEEPTKPRSTSILAFGLGGIGFAVAVVVAFAKEDLSLIAWIGAPILTVGVVAGLVASDRERRAAVEEALATPEPVLVTLLAAVRASERTRAEAVLAGSDPLGARLERLLRSHARPDAISVGMMRSPGAWARGPQLQAWATQGLDALCARDHSVTTASDAYTVVAVTAVLTGATMRDVARGLEPASRALASMIPTDAARILYVESRWIPKRPTGALDDAGLARTFPELGIVATEPLD